MSDVVFAVGVFPLCFFWCLLGCVLSTRVSRKKGVAIYSLLSKYVFISYFLIIISLPMSRWVRIISAFLLFFCVPIHPSSHQLGGYSSPPARFRFPLFSLSAEVQVREIILMSPLAAVAF
eukprot:TRINITY_DN38714_c0_g1_i1.p1 TRINITY_DN38714_c0_g1~~TRINITY_DN38714_c0_g1_i1.p1  ORF type:complete len:120 (+),score=2.89 TRINITY_DN38714_c0_g1_i1:59-418(+)